MPTTPRDGIVHSSPLQADKSAANKKLLCPDFEESAAAWRKAKGDIRGHNRAWEAVYGEDPTNPTQKDLEEMPIPLDPTTGAFVKHPHMLDNKSDKRLLKNVAYSLVRTAKGWSILSYLMNGNKHVYLGSTKPEPKQFALGRITTMIQQDLMK